nr:putative 54s ribosomal protein l32, mitochondrial [Quercus suber]
MAIVTAAMSADEKGPKTTSEEMRQEVVKAIVMEVETKHEERMRDRTEPSARLLIDSSAPRFVALPSASTMAALHIPSASFLSAFLPVAREALLPRIIAPVTRRIPLVQQLRTSVLPGVLLPIPGLLAGLWDGLLRAVPKKKTSHMKKRHRQMAGKALKDVTALNKCSACGRPKRAHVLCPYCVKTIQEWVATGFKTKEQLAEEADEMHEKYNEERRVMGLDPLEQPKAREKK